MGAHKGYLRQAKGIRNRARRCGWCRSRAYAEPGKAAPVTPRLLFKSRYAIVTPEAPGLNISRRVRDEEERRPPARDRP